jgi:hypothetical protein
VNRIWLLARAPARFQSAEIASNSSALSKKKAAGQFAGGLTYPSNTQLTYRPDGYG